MEGVAIPPWVGVCVRYAVGDLRHCWKRRIQGRREENMKLGVLIAALRSIEEDHGDIECELQDAPGTGEPVTSYESFFLVPEEYEDGWRVNIRTWPY